MGIVQLPQESELSNSNHHRAYIELNIQELSHTVELLKSSLQYLQTHQSPFPSSTFNEPDLKQNLATANIPTSFQSNSIAPTSFQNISNDSTTSFQSVSRVPISFQSISPDSFFQNISSEPLSFFQHISNVSTDFQGISPGPLSYFENISNVPTSFCHQSIFNVPKPIPSPIGPKKASSSSHASIASSSTSHCPAFQNLPPANVSSCSTHGLSENQGAVYGSDISLAKAQLEQLKITGKISQELVEEAEVSSPAAQESWDQGEDRTGVSSLVRIPEQLSTWRRRFTTPATKHNRNTITAMCYLPSFEGFNNHSDDSSGWLISSSQKHLNLWQCTSRSSVSDPSLQVKSFQRTEFVMEDMFVDMDAKFLCAFCPYPQGNALCITMHNLGGPAFFKYQGMIHIPCEDASLCTKKSSYGLKMLHLASLQPMGGTFGNSVAVAFDKNIRVYDLLSVSATPSIIVPPKTLWQAHDSPITCMRLNSFVCSLITGASDGCIRLWDMKAKPCNPVGQYLQKDHITCIEMLDGTTMCSGSLDGTFQLHDIRYSTSPFMSIIPDEKPILNMTGFLMHNTVAFTTVDRLYCLEFAISNSMVDDATSRHSSSGSTTGISIFSPSLWSLTPLPSNRSSTGIKWNTRTCTEIYTSQSDGSIAIFAK